MSTPDSAVVKRQLRALIVEDSENDLLMLVRELMRGGYEVTYTRVDTQKGIEQALATEEWDVALSDFSLPGMTAFNVLTTLATHQQPPPCIVISGAIPEEAAVDLLRAGARDFVVKERLARLVPAIEREVREAADRRRLLQAETTLHETRERMQFALDAVGIGFWEWDLQFDTLRWSNVQERLHGLPPGAFAATSAAFRAAIHPDDREAVFASLEAAARDVRDCRIEYRTIWADGSVHWLLAIGRAFADEHGDTVRAAGVGMDITTQRELEEQLRQVQKMESIGNLAGGMAHDFNNLLTVITGYSDLATEEVKGNAAALEYLEGIRAASASATALTGQLLTFSRRQVLMPKVTGLNAIIDNFSKLTTRLVEQHVQIEFRLTKAASWVNVDAGQVEQVLLNLVINARDAMPTGGAVVISTTAETVSPSDSAALPDVPPGDYVVLSVADTGSGMSDQVQARLFEPFFTTKPAGMGTGLGLAVVYGVVKQSGGYITVQSTLGAGTTFRIYFPAEASGPTTPEVQPTGPPRVRGTETILLVEDNAPLRELAEVMLRAHGYTVLTAADGEQAEVISRHRAGIDLALVDVIMPGAPGPTVAETIRRHQPHTKVAYISGYTGDALPRPEVLRSAAFLAKPFNKTQLLLAVRETLDLPQRR